MMNYLEVKALNQDTVVMVCNKDLLATLAHVIVDFSPYTSPDIRPALQDFSKYLDEHVFGEDCRTELNCVNRKWKGISLEVISYDIFSTHIMERLPSIAALNVPAVTSGPQYDARHEGGKPLHPDYDFIDLGALAIECLVRYVSSMSDFVLEEAATTS